MVVEISKDEFDEKVLNAELPVMVDFYGPNCGICQAMAPVLDEIAERYEGSVLFYKVNVYENPVLANVYGVIAIPNFTFFKNGKSVGKMIGAQPVSVIQGTLSSLISEGV